MRISNLVVLLGSSLLATACMRHGTDLDSAESAVDSSDSVESEGNVMMSAVDGADVSGVAALTGDQVAARIAANVALRWQPTGCATVTQSGANITIVYDNCTGPRGLLHVSGELDLVVSVSLTGVISVHGESNGLQVNDADLTISADATYTVAGTDHTLAVQTTGSGTGPRGNAITHTGDYTIHWDTVSLCRSIDGRWATELSNATTSRGRSNVVSVERCADACPTGEVTHTGLANVTTTITFDGTAVARWATSTGRSGTVNLPCGR
jgi:hypothetical protein